MALLSLLLQRADQARHTVHLPALAAARTHWELIIGERRLRELALLCILMRYGVL